MAYDYGSESLGIRNPFKAEGLLRAIRGLVVSLLGINPLLQVAKPLCNSAKTTISSRQITRRPHGRTSHKR